MTSPATLETQTLFDGLCFGEGPRIRHGQLWLSDMHAHHVCVLTKLPDGYGVEPKLTVANRPSGLGWLPNGDLLVVSMTDRLVLRWDGNQTSVHCDLSALVPYSCNDMVVDAAGRAYVGNFGFDFQAGEKQKATQLVCVEPDGSPRVVAEDLEFPNGTVITPDGKTLILAETMGRRLTAFDIAANGDLSGRRVWAELPKGAVPDGICLDDANGIWSASPTSNDVIRQEEGGRVTHRVVVDQGAFACMLDGTRLYVLTAGSSVPEKCQVNKDGRIEAVDVPYSHAGLP